MADKTTKEFPQINTNVSKDGVVSLATRPNQPSSYGEGNLSATDLKKRFDRLANRIIEEHNKLIDLFNSDEILGYLKAHSGSLKSALEQITNTDGNLITKNPADQKGENEVLNDRIEAFYNAIVELQAFTEVKDPKHKDKTLSGVYETIAKVELFKEAVEKDKGENAEAHKAFTNLITDLQEFLGLNEHEGDSPLDDVIKEHISDHNDPESLAHSDIRQSVEEAQTNANQYADGILSKHDDNGNAHAKIRETIKNLSDDFTTHQTAEDAHKDVIDATLKSANDYTDEELKNYIPLSEKGASNGVATLSSDGKIPAAQLPSFVDDVLEYADLSEFPTPGEIAKIYVDLKTNKTYRWSGSKYVEISESLALGETSSTAYRGDLGAKAYAHSQITKGNPHGIDAKTVGLENVVNTGDSAKPTENGTTKFTTGGAYAMKTELEGKIKNIDLSEYYTKDETYNKTEVDGLLANFEPPDDNSQIQVGELHEYDYTDDEGNTKRAKEIVNGNIAFDEQYNDFVVANNIFIDGSTKPENRLIDMWYVDKKLPEKFATIQSLKDGYVAKAEGKGLSTNDFTNALKSKLEGIPEGGASIDEKHIELGDQVSAKGDYSAALNKGIIGSEAVFETEYYGQTITVSLKDAFTKGVSVEAIDVVENTIDVYGTCKVSVWGASISLDLAYAFSKISGERFNFVIEISAGDIKAYYPAIEVKEVKTNNKTCARLTIHKSCSVSGISTLDKVTNIYGGFAYEDGSMTVNSRNIAWGESSFSSGTGNVSIAPNSHTQNISNIASGDAGSASGSFTEAGATAFSTGHKTKALGESSLTFGIRSETKYTESTESIEKEGGKGSIAGGYDTRANARYSAAFGVSTHSDREGQLVCGLANATDTNALFIVGQGNNRNAFTVDKNGKGTLLNLKVGNDAAEVTGGNGTLGVGNRTKAGGESSLTFGIGSQTALTTYGDGAVEGGKGSIAGGYQTKANAPYTAVFGYETHADRQGQLVCGEWSDKDTDAMLIVGAGYKDNEGEHRKNIFTVKRNGSVYANGSKLATVNDIPSLSGYATIDYVDEAISNIDVPEGGNGDCPISEGAGTGAAQMGDRTSANANYSFAGGESSTTLQNNETDPTKQIKANFAFGVKAEAQKNASAAFGYNTKATVEQGFVVGSCNAYNGWSNALFVVGNGTTDTNRSNAFVVNRNGDTYITGKAFSGGKQLATTDTASQNSAGLMSANDKKKLDSLDGNSLGERVFCVNITITFSSTVANAPFNISVAFSYFSKNANINRTTLDGFVTDFMNSFSLGSQVYIPATVFIGAGVSDIRDKPDQYAMTTGLVCMPGRWDAIQQPNFFYTSDKGTIKFTPESLRADSEAQGVTLTTTIRAHVA